MLSAVPALAFSESISDIPGVFGMEWRLTDRFRHVREVVWQCGVVKGLRLLVWVPRVGDVGYLDESQARIRQRGMP